MTQQNETIEFGLGCKIKRLEEEAGALRMMLVRVAQSGYLPTELKAKVDNVLAGGRSDAWS